MATLGKWSGGTWAAGNLPEAWAAPSNLFPTQDRNDGSAYSFANATATLTLPSSGLADGYLFIAAFEYQDTSNGRFNPQGKWIQASGTGSFVGGATGGYNRDNSEDRSYVRAWAFVDSPSASATFQFQWKADSDDATGGTERSELQVIPLYYSDAGIYASTDHTLMGGTTPNVVPGWTTTLEGTSITRSANVITVTGDSKRYLVLCSQFFEGRAGRTQRWHGLDIDGSQENAAKAYSYYRATGDDETGDLFTWLIETAAASVTIEQTCYRGDGVASGQGGANIDGSDPAVGGHAFVVLELNDSAEAFRSTGSTNQNIATAGPVDLQATKVADVDFNDSAAFTRSSDTAMNAEKSMDALLGANVSAASQAIASGGRFTGFAEFTKNGTEDTDSFSGDYLRGNQSSTDTFGWSANLLGFMAAASGDDIGVSATELAGSEGHGGAVHVQAGWLGLWGVNLDSLESAGPTGSGALVASTATSTGAGDSESSGTGALVSQVTVASGSGASSSSGAGAAASSDATGDGSGSVLWVASGAPTAESAVMTGAGVSISSGAGATTTQSASAGGSGVSLSDGLGSVSAAIATSTGEGTILSSSSASLAAGVATAAGSGTSKSTGSVAIAASESVSAGAGTSGSTSSDSLSAVIASTAGSGVSESVGTGTISSVTADASGVGAVGTSASAAVQAVAAVASGTGISSSAGSGSVVAAVATAAGEDSGNIHGSGAPAAGPVILSSAGESSSLGAGSVAAESSSVSGSGVSLSTGIGALVAQAATSSGSDSIDESVIGRVRARLRSRSLGG